MVGALERERERVKSGMVAERSDVLESGIWEGDELNGISERGGDRLKVVVFLSLTNVIFID